MSDENEPIIHIDEGWKAQVEKERELEQTQSEEVAEERADEEAELTPFEYHVSGLAAQAVMALGLMGQGQEGEKVMVDLDYARHLIDALLMLKEKTVGNLVDSEIANLDEAITELERAFEVRLEQAREAQLDQPTIDPNPPFLNPEQ